MAGISVTINTCNEAHHLRACVESVRPLAGEIVVCDMESTDGSAELALELGCTVISHPRMPAPEPDARVAAIEASTGDWILAFDPDMRLLPETCRRLREIAEHDEADMVDFYCRNNFFGQWCPHGHGSQPVFRKFFKRSAFSPRCTNIQTFWNESLSGEAIRLSRSHAIRHYGYATVHQCVSTLARYARREAEQAEEAGVKPSLLRMFWRPARRFAADYLFRLGLIDGVPGLMISAAVARYVYLSERALHDLHRAHQSGGIPARNGGR